jgi:DNA-binding response OmpR family regulator
LNDFIYATPTDQGLKDRVARFMQWESTMRVLICDDSDDLCAALAMALEFEGHVVDQANTGKEALEKLQATRFDALLLDLDLPEESGWEVAAAIRAQPHLDGLRIVVFSGRSRDTDHARSLAAGADVHLTKPATVDEIEDALRGPPAVAALG